MNAPCSRHPVAAAQQPVKNKEELAVSVARLCLTCSARSDACITALPVCSSTGRGSSVNGIGGSSSTLMSDDDLITAGRMRPASPAERK
jgi:hypothetical protein